MRFRRADGTLHDGVASFGRRPTVDDDGAPLLETFLFDFSGDLYGEVCQVSFFGFLRGEEKFDRLDALTAQMKRDEAEARALLAGVRPLFATRRSHRLLSRYFLSDRPSAMQVQPWKIRSIARNMPSTQRLLTGQPMAITTPASAVMMPAAMIQPEPWVAQCL